MIKKNNEATFPRTRLAVKQRRRFRPATTRFAVQSKTSPTGEEETLWINDCCCGGKRLAVKKRKARTK